MKSNGTLRQLIGRHPDAAELREAVELGHPVIRFTAGRFQVAVINLEACKVDWFNIEEVT